MAAIIMASVVTVTSLDLLVIYLPLIGAERHVDASDIGMLLAIRSVRRWWPGSSTPLIAGLGRQG